MNSANTPNSTGEFRIYAFALNLGFRIVTPLVLFALGGRYLDRRINTSPTYLLIGIGISIILTSILLYREAKRAIQAIDVAESQKAHQKKLQEQDSEIKKG